MQLGDAVSIGFEIVYEKEVLNVQFRRQIATIQHPRKVGQFKATMAHGTRYTKAGSGHFRMAALRKKFPCDNIKPGVFLRRKFLIANVRQFPILKTIKRQVDFCAAHIPGENHRAISSFPTPFPSVGGSNDAASLSSRNSSF